MPAATTATTTQDHLTDGSARVGLATQGVLYGIVALLAVRIATGDLGEEADKDGAMAIVARQPMGTVLLGLLAAGLAGMVLWRASLVWRGEGGDKGAKDGAKRLANAGRALLYAGFTYGCVQVLIEGVGSSSGSNEQEATAAVLSWPGGRYIVIAAGVLVILGGLSQWRQPVTQSFLDKLNTSRMTATTEHVVTVIGSIGFVARGVVGVLVGGFLVNAAIDYDPQQANGVDGALKELVQSSYGPALLMVVALGLFAFGAFRVVDAAYRSPSRT